MTTSLIPTLGRAAEAREADIADLRTLLAGVEAGVAGQDPDKCIAQFALDARSVTAAGLRSVGRQAIRAAHVKAFAGSPATTSPRFEVLDLVFIHEDVAVVTTGAWRVQGPGSRIDLDHPSSVVVYVVSRQDGCWWVASRQFTTVVPPG